MSLPPAASLPLRFSLQRNARPSSSSASVTACLHTVLHGAAIYRILDAEFREPYISCGRIFAAAGLTPLTGLFRFGLQPGDWDVSLAGLAPFEDAWVSLSTARHIAGELGFGDELWGLLLWDSRFAWTVVDMEEKALRHNWRLPPNSLSDERYSTSAMLETSFSAVVMLPKGQDIRTQIPVGKIEANTILSWADPWRLLVRWSLLLYEEYIDKTASADFLQPSPPMSPRLRDATLVQDSEKHLEDLLPAFLWDILSAQIQLVNPDLTATLSDKGRAWNVADGQIIARKTERNLTSQLALCDALAHLVLGDLRRATNASLNTVAPEPDSPSKVSTDVDSRLSESAKRISSLEARILGQQAEFEERLEELRAQMDVLAQAQPPSRGAASSTSAARDERDRASDVLLGAGIAAAVLVLAVIAGTLVR